MGVHSFDHIAIPTERPLEMITFYGALGFRVPDPASLESLPSPVFEIGFGQQKINVHLPELWQNEKFGLRGLSALPGSADLCFVWEGGAEALDQTLTKAGAKIETGPMAMRGARGQGVSVYTRDPDQNLVEFIIYDSDEIEPEE